MIKAVIIVIVIVVATFFGFLMISDSQSNQTQDLNLTQQTGNSPQQITPTQTVQISPPVELVQATKAVIKTEKGDITLELYPQDAPKTVSNFAKKSKSGFYNNLTFHRVEDWVVQGGDPLGNGTGGDDMPTELNKKPFIVGSLGVARGPNIQVSNDSQFFITTQEADWLDGQYTNFGMVTDGMDVVKQIKVGDKILSIEVE